MNSAVDHDVKYYLISERSLSAGDKNIPQCSYVLYIVVLRSLVLSSPPFLGEYAYITMTAMAPVFIIFCKKKKKRRDRPKASDTQCICMPVCHSGFRGLGGTGDSPYLNLGILQNNINSFNGTGNTT